MTRTATFEPRKWDYPPVAALGGTGAATSLKEDLPTEQLKAHLMATDEEFRQLAAQHSEYERQIQEIESHVHVTPADEDEEHRLKKLKLHCKDRMELILNRYRQQPVA